MSEEDGRLPLYDAVRMSCGLLMLVEGASIVEISDGLSDLIGDRDAARDSLARTIESSLLNATSDQVQITGSFDLRGRSGRIAFDVSRIPGARGTFLAIGQEVSGETEGAVHGSDAPRA